MEIKDAVEKGYNSGHWYTQTRTETGFKFNNDAPKDNTNLYIFVFAVLLILAIVFLIYTKQTNNVVFTQQVTTETIKQNKELFKPKYTDGDTVYYFMNGKIVQDVVGVILYTQKGNKRQVTYLFDGIEVPEELLSKTKN